MDRLGAILCQSVGAKRTILPVGDPTPAIRPLRQGKRDGASEQDGDRFYVWTHDVLSC